MASSRAAERYSRFLEFLEEDPGNLQLLGDAAVSAREAGAHGEAAELLERYEAIESLPPPLLNLRGLLALDEKRFADAADAFEALLEQNPADASLRFNLAWARAVLQDYAAANDLLDPATITALPSAAALKIRVLHHLGELEEALDLGERLVKRFPGDAPLMSALALCALDFGEAELAQSYALQAGDTDEGLSTIGMLMLSEGKVAGALSSFERALKLQPESPRALLGEGLAKMAEGNVDAAVPLIERSAQIFRTHLGSWVAAGWGHVAQGQYGEARKRFEKVVALDDNFAEGHGGLAVIDAMEGDLASAERRCRVTLGLDRHSLSGALAKSLIAAARGDPEKAQEIRAKAMSTPLTPGGRTLAQAMVAFGGIASRRGSKKPN